MIAAKSRKLFFEDDQRVNIKIMKENITSVQDDSSKTAKLETPNHIVEQNPINGFSAVLVACILSGKQIREYICIEFIIL